MPAGDAPAVLFGLEPAAAAFRLFLHGGLHDCGGGAAHGPRALGDASAGADSGCGLRHGRTQTRAHPAGGLLPVQRIRLRRGLHAVFRQGLARASDRMAGGHLAAAPPHPPAMPLECGNLRGGLGAKQLLFGADRYRQPFAGASERAARADRGGRSRAGAVRGDGGSAAGGNSAHTLRRAGRRGRAGLLSCAADMDSILRYRRSAGAGLLFGHLFGQDPRINAGACASGICGSAAGRRFMVQAFSG